MNDLLKKCELCPRMCGINRYEKQGFCGANDKIKIARASLHMWEEPCISHENGSGTIFFSHCNLKCIYCQNYDISTNNYGKEITINKLSEIMLNLQNKNAHNINLVTPTHYVPQIIEAIKIARKKGLNIPIIYNTSGYERKETIKLLDGYIDIYLTDMKYYDDKYAKEYSKATNYFNHAKEALDEMYKQIGNPKISKNGIMEKGIIVRHLILPELIDDSKKIINYLYKTYKDDIYLSIMNQYTPLENVKNHSSLNRIITKDEYDEVINYAVSLGIENAFIQEGETQKESFIPSFNNEGI